MTQKLVDAAAKTEMKYEQILTIPRRCVEPLLEVEFTPASDATAVRILEKAISSHASRWPRNEETETHDLILQLIPYTAFTHTSTDKDDAGTRSIFMYQRHKETTEGRLSGKLSIGLGGHINYDDSFGCDVHAAILNCINREVEEEVGGRFFNTTEAATKLVRGFTPLVMHQFQGIIYSERKAVDRVHLGLLFVFDVSSVDRKALSATSEFAVNDTPNAMVPISMLKTLSAQKFDLFETWTSIVLSQKGILQ